MTCAFAAGRHLQICKLGPLAFSRTTSHHSPSSARVDSTRCAKQRDHRSPSCSWARCHTSISGCFVAIVERVPHPRCRALLKANMLGLPHLWKRAQTPACFSCGAAMHAWTSLSNVYHVATSRGRARVAPAGGLCDPESVRRPHRGQHGSAFRYCGMTRRHTLVRLRPCVCAQRSWTACLPVLCI